MGKAQKVGPVELSSMAANHPKIATSYFEEPAAYLLSRAGDAPARLLVDCSRNAQSKTGQEDVELEVGFSTQAYSFSRLTATLPPHKVTEYAAVGLALLFLPYLADGEVTHVTRAGDRTDYWVDGESRLIEISGTRAPGLLRPRHRSKVAQGAANPYRAPYFVSVSCFGDLHNVFSFHRVT